MEQSQNDHGDNLEASIASGENQVSPSPLHEAVPANLLTLMQKIEEIKMMKAAYLSKKECLSALEKEIWPKILFLLDALNTSDVQYFIQLRLQTDITVNRAALQYNFQNLKRIAETASKQQEEYDAVVARLDTWTSVLTGQIDQLRAQTEAQGAASNVATTKERDAGAMETSDELTGMKEEFCKLESDTDQLINQFEQCKITSEPPLSN